MTPDLPRPHLAASCLALLLACAMLAGGYAWCRKIERQHVADLATDLSDPKLQGVAIQREAFSQPDLLVLYGSSELVRDVPLMAAEFFEDYPTGFRVFPVGKAGTSQLAVLQKLAAVGGDLRGRKVALSLSPSFFFEEKVESEWYEGNFSALQAGELVFSDELSFSLKHAAARRLLAYPETLENHWLLDAVLHRLARGTTLDRALYYAAWPLGKLRNGVARLQDHFESALHIIDLPDAPDSPRRARVLNWAENLRKAEALSRDLAAKSKGAPKLTQKPRGSRDELFLARLKRATEWTDFELTLRTLRELGAQPLLLSMPVHARDLETVGVSPKARAQFPAQLERIAAKHNAPLVYFRTHEEDPLFFADHLDHLGAKGWMYYNRTLDNFYHGRNLSL
ncbi:MAG: D-alanyl-lipoteichoic acid biosynthesis protein DltD [Chthoniobacteraceae bacterium]